MARNQSYRKNLVGSSLITRDELNEIIKELEQRHAQEELGAVSEADLERVLISRGIITRYQSDQLHEGRTKFNLGPYTITDSIGQGGMGQVFKACHHIMGRECAVKILPIGKSTPYTVTNFQREIQMQAKMDHPNLVRAFDAGKDGQVHYLVTEFVPGMDLRQYIRSHGYLDMNQAASIIRQVANGLQYAHDQGLTHRDIKPGNIMVSPDGTAKLSDLGLSGFIDDSENDPRHGKIVGTADYLAPELIRNPKDVSTVSDIYSLGCTLYYAITGKVPFPGGNTKDKVRRHLHEHPWHPRRFNPNVTEEFVDLIADTMEKNPEKRLATAGEVAQRLNAWTQSETLLPATTIAKSAWSDPPVPTYTEYGIADTHGDLDEAVDIGSQASDQYSQVTYAVADQSTDASQIHAHPLPSWEAPNLPAQRRLALALAIAIPASLFVGMLIGKLLFD